MPLNGFFYVQVVKEQNGSGQVQFGKKYKFGFRIGQSGRHHQKTSLHEPGDEIRIEIEGNTKFLIIAGFQYGIDDQIRIILRPDY
jgi:hypothetical protein